MEIESYRQYLAKIKLPKKLTVKKLLGKLTCLHKTTISPLLLNYIIPTDIVSLEDFIVTQQDALAIVEFCGIDFHESSEFLDTAQAHNTELCVNSELQLYNVHVLKYILEHAIING